MCFSPSTHPPRQRGRAGDRVDELFGGARQGEVGVFGDRLLVEPPAVSRAKPLRQVAALEIQVSGFGDEVVMGTLSVAAAWAASADDSAPPSSAQMMVARMSLRLRMCEASLPVIERCEG